MRSKIAGRHVRVGLVALAALGVFAAPGSASAAVPSQEIAVAHSMSVAAPTPAECNAIREKIAGLDSRVMALQDLLGEATPSQKPAIIKMILRLEAQIAALEAQLQGCPA